MAANWRVLAEGLSAISGEKPALLVGCHALGLSLPCCEVDVVVFKAQARSEVRQLFGLTLALHVLAEEPREAFARWPERLVGAIPLYDPHLELGSLVAALARRSNALGAGRALSAARAGLRALTCARIGQAEAGFIWLCAGALLLAEAELLRRGQALSPTHLFTQLEPLSPELARLLKVLVGGSRKAIGARLEAYKALAEAGAEMGAVKRATWLLEHGADREAACLLTYRLLREAGVLELGLDARAPALSLRPRLQARLMKAGWPSLSPAKLQDLGGRLLELISLGWGPKIGLKPR